MGQMAKQDHEQLVVVATYQNEWHRGDANEGTVEMGRPRAANECRSNAKANFLFRVVLRRQK